MVDLSKLITVQDVMNSMHTKQLTSDNHVAMNNLTTKSIILAQAVLLVNQS